MLAVLSVVRKMTEKTHFACFTGKRNVFAITSPPPPPFFDFFSNLFFISPLGMPSKKKKI